MARGGSRQGTPGQAYGNRSDLNAPKPPATQFTGQPYGQAKQQEQSQKALPIGAPPIPPGAPAGGQGPPMGPEPGSFGDPHRPTERPNEPVTAGAAMGPGPGPEVLSQQQSDGAVDQLRAVYGRFPSSALEQIIEELDRAHRPSPA